jgi:hypothetical protein
MGNLAITAAQVKRTGGTASRKVTGGATGTRGQGVYKDSADNEHKLADASALATAVLDGILLTDMTDGSECLIAPRGCLLNVGATTVAAIAYVLSATAGAFCPIDDLLTPEIPVIAFWGNGTAIVEVLGDSAGVAIPA